jgi:hypothetical protein
MTKACPYIALFGEILSPKKAESETDLVFKDKHEVGDLRTPDGKPYEQGYALLEAPQELDGEQQIQWLLEAAYRNRSHLGLSSGVDGKFHVTYAYDSQCNLEYGAEFLSKLCDIGLALTISCYEDKSAFEEREDA